MGKAKTFSQKSGGKQPTEKPRHTIDGGVCNGYDVLDPEGNPVAHYEFVWDAIDHRNHLNGPDAEHLTKTESKMKF